MKLCFFLPKILVKYSENSEAKKAATISVLGEYSFYSFRNFINRLNTSIWILCLKMLRVPRQQGGTELEFQSRDPPSCHGY